ncbi:hypothetical protein UFOVP227_25 [uncultured Caudovirales phage]|uniref:Uncharacterized protein n=1 Tax=uncultured Caudovirales phage TaxID=2100421 RepID=A0A6J7WLV4_9CAUD|nr:hypothetical protein UFOVP227_25 [uncultured Caudovirales phage]
MSNDRIVEGGLNAETGEITERELTEEEIVALPQLEETPINE